MDGWGNVFTSKMHDLMHDLATSVAGSMITKLESKEKTISDKKTRHVSVAGNIDFSFVIPTSLSKASKIWTLLCLGEFKSWQEYSSTSCEANFSSLKFLRVLGLHERQFDLVPSTICKLKHLRDLDLSGNYKIKKLPDAITRLQNLYTLRLSGCESLKELPRGITKLVNLRHDCKGANLKGREHIQFLTLDWRPRESEENVNARDENMAFEDWVPHPNLKELNICCYGGVKFSIWLLSLTNLVRLNLSKCRKLKYLPPLSRLPSLENLHLSYLDEIEYVSDCSDNNDLSSFSSSAFFPSLKVIDFSWCPNLKGWWRRSDSYNVDVNTTDHALLFPHLSYLRIFGCPMLTSFPMFPHLEGELILYSASWKPVQQTITNASSSSASSTPIVFSSPPLSKLNTIIIQQIEDLETLPEDGLQNLISLQALAIRNCQRLKSLSQGVQYLPALTNVHFSDCPMLDLGNDEDRMQWKGLKSLISLEFMGMPKLVSLPLGLQHVTTLRELQISNCPVLDLGNDEHGMQWKGLKSLISLEFTGMPKLVSLPLGLQHVTTLQKFRIYNCSSLVVIPEWICNWASLEEFTISKCSGLTSLPEAMTWLTSLRVLLILDCPVLDLGNNEHGMQWKGLKSLISLNFTSMTKLVSLPLGLQHVTTLQKLRIYDCSSLVVIPEWICNWASIEEFTIYNCSGLTSLPEAMSRLTSLKTLEIHDCPILLRRCELGGEDRPKIAHIPKLDFRLSP